MVGKREEQVMRKLLIDSSMCVLLPEDQIPRTSSGRKILSGLFCVPHKDHSDRLIFDRRPANATERRLKWCHLPHGTCFCSLKLKPGEDVRCSGDDISNYFYHLELEHSLKRGGNGHR